MGHGDGLGVFDAVFDRIAAVQGVADFGVFIDSAQADRVAVGQYAGTGFGNDAFQNTGSNACEVQIGAKASWGNAVISLNQAPAGCAAAGQGFGGILGL